MGSHEESGADEDGRENNEDDEDDLSNQQVYIGSLSFRIRWKRRCPFLIDWTPRYDS